MVDIEQLRTEVQRALAGGMSADAIAAEVGDVTGQTILNFAQPGHRILGRTRRAMETWFLKQPRAGQSFVYPPLPEAGKRFGVAEGRIATLERSLRDQRAQVRRLRQEIEARERVIELTTDALLDAALTGVTGEDPVPTPPDDRARAVESGDAAARARGASADAGAPRRKKKRA